MCLSTVRQGYTEASNSVGKCHTPKYMLHDQKSSGAVNVCCLSKQKAVPCIRCWGEGRLFGPYRDPWVFPPFKGGAPLIAPFKEGAGLHILYKGRVAVTAQQCGIAQCGMCETESGVLQTELLVLS